ncbi:MAG: hypothetical protein AABX99_04160 [Nanoarchaeota archaeon]
MIFDTYQILGWIGMFLMILDYLLLSTKKVKFNSIPYNLLNLFGGIGVLISSFYAKLWPVVVLNIFWSGVAIFSIYKILTTKPTYKELK